MGGEGSGRRPDPTNVVLKSMQQPQQPVMTSGGQGIFLPNYSGIKDIARKDKSLSGSQIMGDTLVLSGSAVLPSVYGSSIKMMIHQTAPGQVARLKFKADSGLCSFLYDSSATSAANTGKWQFVSNNSGFFYLGMLNDLENSESTAFLIDRVNNIFHINMPFTVYYNISSNGIYDDMGNSGVIQIGDVTGTYSQTNISVDGSSQTVAIDNCTDFKMNGVSGFTGTGSYTNFTIEKGIITSAS